jgi:hypothetical protein
MMTDFNLDEADPGAIMDHLHTHLKQVVALHTAMFEKLLFQNDRLPLELAELFEDAANTYLDFSEEISQRALGYDPLAIEKQLDADVEPARRGT